MMREQDLSVRAAFTSHVVAGKSGEGGGFRGSDRQRNPKSHMISLNEFQSRDIASLLQNRDQLKKLQNCYLKVKARIRP